MDNTSIPLDISRISSIDAHSDNSKNPLPKLLHTPSGLALLELQGTINLPEQDDIDTITSTNVYGGLQIRETPIGRLVFPLYNEDEKDGGAGWMKKVYMYVGKHQRLTGEVKKLPKAIAVIRKKDVDGIQRDRNSDTRIADDENEGKELEVVEIVKYKIIFSIRPEPVGTKPEVVAPLTAGE